jgi:hypothetical protein
MTNDFVVAVVAVAKFVFGFSWAPIFVAWTWLILGEICGGGVVCVVLVSQ